MKDPNQGAGGPATEARVELPAGARGALRLPPSKAQAQRAILLAGLAPGHSLLFGLGEAWCDDVTRAVALLGTLGRPASPEPGGALRVVGEGCGHAGGIRPAGPLRVGESGTLARIATAIAALCCRGAVEVRGAGTLGRRSSVPLVAALEGAGARVAPVQGAAPGGWPLVVDGVGPPPDLVLVDPVSSQELTALLVVAAAYPDAIQVHLQGDLPSSPYVELTRDVLEAFGVEAVDLPPRPGHARCLEVRGSLRPARVELEPDASAAAVGLAAAALVGGLVRVPGPWAASRQGDADAPTFLAALGAPAERRDDVLVCSGRAGHGAELDLSGHPDLAPPLAAVAIHLALGAEATTRLTGLATLRRKESDRLAGLVTMARAVGAGARVDERDGDASLVLEPGPGPSGPVRIDPAGDHRIAFAGALVGLTVPGLVVTDPTCVGKSWPGFWDDLAALGRAPS